MTDPVPAPAPLPQPDAPVRPAPPSGFGGWLILPVIGLCLSPIRTLYDMLMSIKDYEIVARIPNGTFLIIFEVALNVGYLALQIWVLVVMFGRRTSFPMWFTWLWAAALFLPVLDLLVIMAVTKLPPDQIVDAATVKSFAGALVMGLWVWYMHVSVRVKNTFTN